MQLPSLPLLSVAFPLLLVICSLRSHLEIVDAASALLNTRNGYKTNSYTHVKGCNKTIRTTRTIRSPKLTKDNKNQPLTCVYRVLGYEDSKEPSVFELHVQDFQVGKLVNESTCLGGHLTIVDSSSRSSSAGYLCGRARRSRTYLSEAVSLTLVFHVDSYSRHTFFRAQSSVLPHRLARERHKELAATQPGLQVPGTHCDRLFLNCIGFCDLMSPGYPGFYPRNLTCRYTISFNNTDTRVTIGGQYFDKFDLWGAPGFQGHRISHVCPYDFIRIYDGLEAGSPVIGRFCGRGTLPRIVTQSSEVLVELVTSVAGSMSSDGYHLSVGSERRPPARFGQEMSKGTCDWTFSSREQTQGMIYSLRHWYPPRTKCTYRFAGVGGEKVWINFQGFNSHRGSRCHDRLRIFDSPSPEPRFLLGEYCGLRRPNKTLISSGNNLLIVFESADGSWDGLQFEYSAYFMFVNTTPSDSAVANTHCDQVFASGKNTRGTFDMLPNRLQLMKRLFRCQVKFVGKPTEQVRLVLETVRFDPVKQCVQAQKTSCSETKVSPVDHVAAYDTDGALLDCLCADAAQPLEVQSRGSVLRLYLNLYHVHYLAHREASTFIFRGKYEFIPAGCGLATYKRPHGEVSYQSSQSRGRDNITCRWNIETDEGTNVLLKILKLSLPGNCSQTNLKVYLAWQQVQYVELCGGSRVREVLPPGWNDVPAKLGNRIVVELMMRGGLSDVVLRFRWSQVHRNRPGSYQDCDYLCPDNRTCLGYQLLCDGVIDCPETDFVGDPLDESHVICRQSEYFVTCILVGSIVSCSIVITACSLLCLWQKQRGGWCGK